MQASVDEIDLIPAQSTPLGCPEAMPECQQNHGRIPMPVTVITGRLHHAFNLALGQVLAGPIMGVGETTARDCSLFSAWRGAGWYRIHWDKSGVLSTYYSHYSSFKNSVKRGLGAHGKDQGAALVRT